MILLLSLILILWHILCLFYVVGMYIVGAYFETLEKKIIQLNEWLSTVRLNALKWENRNTEVKYKDFKIVKNSTWVLFSTSEHLQLMMT